MPAPISVTSLPSGEALPVLGQGTWTMAVDARQRKEEIASLRLGIELGMTLIDTAEMYADGGAEKVVAQAIAGRRNDVFLVSKVLPVRTPPALIQGQSRPDSQSRDRARDPSAPNIWSLSVRPLDS